MIWNVIIDCKTADFKWFKNLHNCFCEFAKQHKVTLHTLETPEECSALSEGSLLILLGINPEWFAQIEKNIQFKNITVVLMIGYGNFKNNRTINIHYDMQMAIKKSIELLREKGREKTACFGIQYNDSSDAIKAEAFAEYLGYDDIYYDQFGMENCFNTFFENIERYDSVICSNDIVALFLQKKCKDNGISVPNKLHVIGIGNLWISSHCQPSITSFKDDMNDMVEVLWRILNNQNEIELYSKVDICLDPKIIHRESTNDKLIENNTEKSFRFSPVLELNEDLDPQVCRIRDIDHVFSCLSNVEIDILNELVNQKPYEEIATKIHISIDTVKYHIKKVYCRLGIHNRNELFDIVKEYNIVFKN